MAHGKPRDPHREQRWRRLIQRWKNSGLTVRAFCNRHHITQPSFYTWRRELKQCDAATTFVPTRVVTDDQPAPSTPIKIVDRQHTAGPDGKERLVMELTMTRMVKARPASEWVSRLKLLP
jgi:hypothetical protein